MYCDIYNTCRSKTYNNKCTKAKKGEMEIYSGKDYTICILYVLLEGRLW